MSSRTTGRTLYLGSCAASLNADMSSTLAGALPPDVARQGRALPPPDEEPGAAVDVQLPVGSGEENHLVHELLQQSAPPPIDGQPRAGGRLLRESQGGAIATGADQTQDGEGSASIAHADAASGRLTVEDEEVSPNSRLRLVSLVARRQTTKEKNQWLRRPS